MTLGEILTRLLLAKKFDGLRSLGWRKIATPNLIQEGEGFTLDSNDTSLYLSDDMRGADEVGEADNGMDQDKEVQSSETNSSDLHRLQKQKSKPNGQIVYFASFLHLSAKIAQRAAATSMKIDLLEFGHVRSSPPLPFLTMSIPSMGPLWPAPKTHIRRSTLRLWRNWNRC